MKLPEIPDDDKDFTPELARKIIAQYQEIIGAPAQQAKPESAALLPCPLCGGDASYNHIRDGVQCLECGCRVSTVVDDPAIYWNRRTHTARVLPPKVREVEPFEDSSDPAQRAPDALRQIAISALTEIACGETGKATPAEVATIALECIQNSAPAVISSQNNAESGPLMTLASAGAGTAVAPHEGEKPVAWQVKSEDGSTWLHVPDAFVGFTNKYQGREIRPLYAHPQAAKRITGAEHDIVEEAACLIWAELCPGLIMGDEDITHYRAAAKAVLDLPRSQEAKESNE